MSHAFLRCSREPAPKGIAFLFSFLFLCTASVFAQDAVRPSLAGEAAAEARRQDVDRIPYNLLVGPIRFRVSASVGVEYNDNINFADVNTQDDVIIRPNLTLDAIWPITQLNTLRLDLGIGYAFYLDHDEDNTRAILIAPNSQIAFDIFVGDFRINIHDRMSIQQDPIAEPALSNVANYARFENTGGVSVLWDLNQALVDFGYDHYNFVSLTNQFDYLDRNADIVFGSVDFLLTPIVPEVLKAKVAVFVDLFKKTEQVCYQARQLHELEEAQHRRELADGQGLSPRRLPSLARHVRRLPVAGRGCVGR